MGSQRDDDIGDLIGQREMEADWGARSVPQPAVVSWLDELRRRRAEIVRELCEVDRAIAVAEKARDAEREAVR